MRVLVGYERSGVVRDAFAARGHESYSCDLLPSESSAGRHYQCDFFEIMNYQWDLIIFHYPCTTLCKASLPSLYRERGRFQAMRYDGNHFRRILSSRTTYICGENPVPHRHAVAAIGRKYDQIINPWQFGHGETKPTCLWLKNLPPLLPTDFCPGREHRLMNLPASKNRAYLRSITYQGFADAMASQWGDFIDQQLLPLASYVPVLSSIRISSKLKG